MNQPTVFLSFAGNDRSMAYRLAADLAEHHIDTFLDERDILPSAHQITWVGKKMAAADYCVLLWSTSCVGRPWVDLEREMAMHRELTEGHTFLFVIRIDDTELPLELRVRRFLNGHHDWPAAVHAVVAHLAGDRAARTPVHPAPDGHDPSISVALVRNQALRVTHLVGIPEAADPLVTVRAALSLPETRSEFGGAFTIEFAYRLLLDGEAFASQRIDDGTLVDLEVTYRATGSDGSISERVYRTLAKTSDFTDESIKAACYRAFKHLLP